MCRLPVVTVVIVEMIVLLASVPRCLAQNAPPTTAASPDEAAVRRAVSAELTAWEHYDAKRIAACHTDTVTWQNPFGVRIQGRAALERFLAGLFVRPGYRSGQSTRPPMITDVHVLSPTTAVVWSEETSEGQIDEETNKPMAPRHTHYVEVLVKVHGAWLISDSMIMDEYPRESPVKQ